MKVAPALKPSAQFSRTKRVGFAFTAVAGFFVCLELALALLGVRPAAFDRDPFVGFSSYLPLFIEEDSERVTARNKYGWFNRQRFRHPKPSNTYRIFSVGGSTTHGRPYDDRASFSGWLRAYLKAADPSKNWDVINAGGVSYASYRVAALMEELVAYEPDLFVIYTGHNEFLERRTYEAMFEMSEAVSAAAGLLSHTRTYAAGGRILARMRGDTAQPSQLAAEVDTILANSVGPSDYHRNDAFRSGVIEHFRFNLKRMIQIAESAGARVVLVTPASNLKDCGPFKSEIDDAVTAAEAARLRDLLGASDAANAPAEALALLDQARRIDPRHPGVHYSRGRALLALDRASEADRAFRRARDEDVCALRATSEIVEIVRETAAERALPLVDFEAMANDRAMALNGSSIPGNEQFVDHVHLDIDGYGSLGLALFELLREAGVTAPEADLDAPAIDDVRTEILALIDHRSHGVALRNLARVYSWAGKSEEAGRIAAQALDVLGGDAESFDIIGRGFAEQGDRAAAIEAFQQALAANPEFAQSHESLGSEYLAVGRIDDAIAHFREAIRLEPSAAVAHSNLGLALASKGRSETALHHYGEALRLRPESAEAHSNMGVELTAQGRMEEAVKHFEQAIALRPDYIDALNNLGFTLMSLGEPDRAAAVFEKALAIRPEHPHLHYNLGIVLQMRGEVETAAEHYRTALKLQSDYAEAHYNLGILLVGKGSDAEGLTHLRRALDLDPSLADRNEKVRAILGP